MPPFDSAFVEKLPWLMQVVIYAAIFVATTLAMVWGYQKRPAERNAVDDRISAVEAAQAQLLREAVDALTRLARHSDDLLQLAESKVRNEVRVATALEGILAQLREEASYQHGWRASERRHE